MNKNINALVLLVSPEREHSRIAEGIVGRNQLKNTDLLLLNVAMLLLEELI